jgi:alpha,alpha-trehalase
MKRIVLSLSLAFTLLHAYTQNPTPDKLYGALFREVQQKRVFEDNKTFVDCTPKYSPETILKKYNSQRSQPDFDLREFVLLNFTLPQSPVVHVTPGLPLREHLEELWNTLTRPADTPHRYSSLLPLKHPYIIPGGRFREIYYWDSYFTMQGVAASKRFDLIEHMIDNFESLIIDYGHIPNGNRNYYLGRSQPPYFAMMVDLLHSHSGDEVYKKYYKAMQKEYKFWMEGKEKLKTANVYRRLVKMPDGSILNRHWDDVNLPRQESYAEDVATGKKYVRKDGKAYINLRASAESGWDFCSRWFADTTHLITIETTDMVPIDLNCLLYAYENILSKAAAVNGENEKSKTFKLNAEKRKASVLKYLWNDELKYFFDYDRLEKHTSNIWTIGGVMPLFTNLADAPYAEHVKNNIEEKFLKDGGVTTSLYNTGEQWDAPNGWPPLQFTAVRGLLNYHYDDLAANIAGRWMKLNEKVFTATGKMMEKYNVYDINIESGGGEYPTQDGFGWTNGVYLAFYELFRKE